MCLQSKTVPAEPFTFLTIAICEMTNKIKFRRFLFRIWLVVQAPNLKIISRPVYHIDVLCETFVLTKKTVLKMGEMYFLAMNFA